MHTESLSLSFNGSWVRAVKCPIVIEFPHGQHFKHMHNATLDFNKRYFAVQTIRSKSSNAVTSLLL